MQRRENTPDTSEFYVLVKAGELLPDVFLRHILRNLNPKEQRYLAAALSREIARATEFA